MDYFIGVDIGTTSTKSEIFDAKGNLVGKSQKVYKLYQDIPDMAEEDPKDIFNAVLATLNQVIQAAAISPKSIKFISFSSAMHSLLLMDKNNEPLSRIYTWADNRSAKSIEDFKDSKEGFDIYKKTGVPIHAMTPWSKLIWLKKTNPALFDATARFVDIKSYLFFKFFGEYSVDYSIASGSGLLNISTLDWDDEILKRLGINRKQLPKLVDTNTIFKNLTNEVKNKLLVSKNTSFVIGAADGPLSNLGLGAIKDGDIAITVGTSGAIRKVVNKPIIDPNGKLFCYYLSRNKWVIGGATNNGGNIFQWLKNNVLSTPNNQFDSKQINRIANTVSPGSNGVLFYPYLSGERAPTWNTNAKGSFIGLNRTHTNAHMARSAMEGTIYNLYSILLMVESLSGSAKKVMAAGGFAKSELWKHIMSDVFETPIIVPDNFESSCLGAVLIGMDAVNIVSNNFYDSGNNKVSTYEPNKENFEVYRRLYPLWVQVGNVLEVEYDKITQIQNEING